MRLYCLPTGLLLTVLVEWQCLLEILVFVVLILFLGDFGLQ